MNAYAELRQRFRRALLVPVFNDAILKGIKLREDFPFSRAVEGPRAPLYAFPHVEGANRKIAPLLRRCPWQASTRNSYRAGFRAARVDAADVHQFRELELRLLLETLRASPPGIRF